MWFLVPLYAVSLFISAFLLFSVQPMVGKYLLPLLGGGPSVWNTAMLFFQLLLLGGYAYAHVLTRLFKPRTQCYVHIALFLLAALSLPPALPFGSDPTGHDPLFWQISTMILMAAAPFFILSSSAPLLQQWFATTHHARAGNPYFLYVASNAGSMLALLSYPIVIEPMLRLHDQSVVWSWGYILLAALLVVCGLASRFPKQASSEIYQEHDVITWKRRSIWLLLAFIPSSLMLGVTTFITTDVITVPLFWVIPLALYLLSFIIAFSEKPFFTLPLTRIVQAISALLLLFFVITSNATLIWSIAVIHLVFFFFTALMCHQELAALKPRARHLTEFYLLISLGGAMGGIFNSLLAPLLFKLPYEYMIVIIASLFCRYISDPEHDTSRLTWEWTRNLKNYDWKIPFIVVMGIAAAVTDVGFIKLLSGSALALLCFSYFNKRWLFGSLYLLVLLMNPIIPWESLTKTITIARNYYGVLLVQDKIDVRSMIHGNTNHGGQSLDPAKRFKSFEYYGPGSGLADIYKTSRMKGSQPQDIAILGLGTGSNACFYNSRNRHFDYFKINPAVIAIAENPEFFTFLSDCSVDYTIHEGDGRLLMDSMADQKYDFILVDVFTSDNIPMHVITREAVEIYQKKLKPDGILLFHTSNNFFNLAPELGAIAVSLDKKAMNKIDNPKRDIPRESETYFLNYPNSYVVIAGDQVRAETHRS